MSRMPRRATIAAAVALFSVSLGACDLAMSGFHEEAKDTWTKTYPLGPNGRLEIVNTNGSIQAEPTDGSQVEINAERIGRAATQQGAKEMLKNLEMREDVSSDRVHIESKSTSHGFHGYCEVRYTVHVPKSATIDLRETNGRLEVIGLTHGVRLSTTNGQITGRKLDGEVHVSTTNGHVDLQMAAVSQDIEAETTNGSIAVQVPSTASADISARVTNGHVGVEGLPSLKADDENSRRRFTGQLNGGGHTIRLQTTNGGITISGGSASASGSKGEPVERER